MPASIDVVGCQDQYEAASEAVQAVALGTMTRDEAVARAAAKLAGKVGKVRYDSGAEADADVALRRHVVTQAARAGGRLTMEAMRAYGHRLVITDAHFGARPSHAEWQGKPACMDGPATVDDVKYPGLAQLTGYGTVQGLHGANCRHSINPYYPGITELPDRSFAAERERFGMGPEEYYEATQRQRAMERAIRGTKRQIAAMEQAGVGLESPAYVQKRLVLGRQQKRLREWCSEHNLQRVPDREKAYGVAKQPRALTGDKWKAQPRVQSKRVEPFKWSNAEMEALKTPDEVADRLMSKHGIKASDSFKALPLDAQKSAAAGVERALTKYGKASARYIEAEENKKCEGVYDWRTGAIIIATDTTDAYMTGYHEALHAIDAERSSHMKAFQRTMGREAYTLFSESVLNATRKTLGLRSNSKKFRDMLTYMAGSIKMYNYLKNKPEEIVIFALEIEEYGKTTPLSAAIAREFENAKTNSR
ncbi:MAG: phage minor capsid protein [Coriobacteriales bacterium]